MKEIFGMKLLPPKPGNCPECGVDHNPLYPHNAQSLYYQYSFYADHNRWPNWGDAMAHCTPEMQAIWKKGLMEKGAKEEQFIIHEDGKETIPGNA